MALHRSRASGDRFRAGLLRYLGQHAFLAFRVRRTVGGSQRFLCDARLDGTEPSRLENEGHRLPVDSRKASFSGPGILADWLSGPERLQRTPSPHLMWSALTCQRFVRSRPVAAGSFIATNQTWRQAATDKALTGQRTPKRKCLITAQLFRVGALFRLKSLARRPAHVRRRFKMLTDRIF